MFPELQVYYQRFIYEMIHQSLKDHKSIEVNLLRQESQQSIEQNLERLNKNLYLAV